MFKELRNNNWKKFSSKRLLLRNILLILFVVYIITYMGVK